MGKAIKLSDKLVNEASIYAKFEHRTAPKQIEYWAHIGKVAQDNPDLSYADIKGILMGIEEIEHGLFEEYAVE